MKKYFIYFLLVTFAFALNACSKEDDKEPEVSILGKWYLDDFVLNAHIVGEEGEYDMQMTGRNPSPPIFVDFQSNGTFLGQNGVMVAHIVITGGLNMEYDMPISNTLPTDGTWDREDNLLTFHETEGLSTTYRIESLTGSSLVLYTNQDITEFPLDVMEGVETFSATVKMRR